MGILPQAHFGSTSQAEKRRCWWGRVSRTPPVVLLLPVGQKQSKEEQTTWRRQGECWPPGTWCAHLIYEVTFPPQIPRTWQQRTGAHGDNIFTHSFSFKSSGRGKPGKATNSGRYGSLPFDADGYCCRHPNVQLAKKKTLGGFKILHDICPECLLDNDAGGRKKLSRRKSRGTG